MRRAPRRVQQSNNGVQDMETMLYNASAAKSPLAAGAKLFNKLTRGFRPK
jgi:hypothetical protein